MALALKNAHPYDSKITFQEEGHLYTIEGMEGHPISVTTLIHHCFPQFNADLVIDKMMKSHKWPQSKYYGQTREEIKAGWDANGTEASKLGTLMHEDIERFLNGEEMLNPNTTEISYFNLFWGQFNRVNPGFWPYRTEWLIYMDNVAGSVDCVLINKNNEGIILDWKRSKEIKKSNPYENGYGVLSCLENCNYNHYRLQLNIYRHILETRYGLKIVGMYNAIFHPNHKCYQSYFMEKYDVASIWDEIRLSATSH